MMRRILILIISFVFVSTFGFCAMGESLTNPELIYVSNIIDGGNSDPAKPVTNLLDNDTNTVWATTATAPSGALIQLEFESEAFIDYLELQGVVKGGGEVAIYYSDAKGVWQPFLGRRHTPVVNGKIDLSWSRALTKQLRLVFKNTSGSTRLGNIGEILVYGHLLADNVRFNGDVTVSSESIGYSKEFLIDNNTRTVWRAANNAKTTVTFNNLEFDSVITNVKYYAKDGSGVATFSALVGDTWAPFGSAVNLATVVEGWHSIAVPELMAKAIRIEIASSTGATYVGGISEFEVWGNSPNEFCKTQILAENFSGSFAGGLELVGVQHWQDAELWLTVPAGVLNIPVEMNINGVRSNPAPLYITGAGCNQVRLTVPVSHLKEGRNYFSLEIYGVQAEDLCLVLTRNDGTIRPVSATSSINMSDITDLWRYTAVAPTNTTAMTLTWEHPVALDGLRIFGVDAIPANASVMIWQNDSWVNAGFVINGNILRFTGGTAPTTKVRLQTQAQVINGLMELEPFGSFVEQGSPTVVILQPQDHVAINPGETISLKGLVDDTTATVTVNGNLATRTGHYFQYNLTAPATCTDARRTATVVARDGQGRTGQVSLVYYVAQPPVLTCGNREISYTAENQVAIGGTAAHATAVTINGQAVTLNNGSYSTVVSLKEGDNLFLIEATNSKNAVARLTRHIISDTQAPLIKISQPLNNSVVTNPVQISGFCSDVSPVEITVNDNTLKNTEGVIRYIKTLPSGTNFLTIKATDYLGHEATETITVQVQSDTSNGFSPLSISDDGGGYEQVGWTDIPSLDGYKDAPSPFGGYFQNSQESVSNSSGALSLQAVDLMIPGREGMDLVVKRLYSTGAAQSDANYENNKRAIRTQPLRMSMGKGWTLNVPYIEFIYEKDAEKRFPYLRLPEGQTVRLSHFKDGSYFSYHEGVHFVIYKQDEKYTMFSSDGTKYVFNKVGLPLSRTAPSGKYTIYYEFKTITIGELNGFEDIISGAVKRYHLLKKITDSTGRTINFNYAGDYITSIEANGRTVARYSYDQNGYLTKVTDVEGRATEYKYSEMYVYDSGDIERHYKCTSISP